MKANTERLIQSWLDEHAGAVDTLGDAQLIRIIPGDLDAEVFLGTAKAVVARLYELASESAQAPPSISGGAGG